MANVAILGFGIVGSGVFEVLNRNNAYAVKRASQEVKVKYICDIRDFSSHEHANLFVNNIDVILNDEEVDVIVETIGGVNPAYIFVKQSLLSGRHVVTSNKELVATHGAELLKIAKQKRVCFLFEASVGGGTPVITPLYQCLAANVVNEITGIVNGTTNFMLTKMAKENLNFEQALKIAQQLGYAETTDPSADIDGIDAQRKIAILASIFTGRQVHVQDVKTKGIADITPIEIKAAEQMNCAVRLIAWAKLQDDASVVCGVEPCFVPLENRLASVQDVFNAIFIKADMLGDVIFYGQGAGKLPTASAVVADILDALVIGPQIHDSLFWQETLPQSVTKPDLQTYDYYVRLSEISAENLNKTFKNVQIINNDNNYTSFIVKNITANQLEQMCKTAIGQNAKVGAVLKCLPQ